MAQGSGALFYAHQMDGHEHDCLAGEGGRRETLLLAVDRVAVVNTLVRTSKDSVPVSRSGDVGEGVKECHSAG